MAKHHHYKGGRAATDFNTVAKPFHVMLATPSSRGFPTAFLMSMVATVEALVRFGYRCDVHVLDGDCHVDDARNKIFREFLTTDCTDLIFIDSDMGWRAENVIKLIEAEGDIVAGIYRHKNDVETYPFHPGQGERHPDADGWVGVPKLPTGFMRIRRAVIEGLHEMEVARKRYFWDSPEDEATGKPPIAAICERAFAHELNLNVDAGDRSDRHSGDLVLCLKARHLGFTCFANVEMHFEHVGEKSWSGNLGLFLRSQQGVDTAAFAAAIQRIRDGSTNPNDFQRLYDAFAVKEWPMQAPALHELFHIVRNGSGDVLETGSGLSTIVIGLALEGTDRLCHTLEHDVLYCRQTSRWLVRYNLSRISLLLAPLVPMDDSDKLVNWYCVEPGQLPATFGVALIDGPPHKYGRDGVFRILGDKIANATLFIDDAARERFDIPSHDIEMRTGDGRTYAVAVPKPLADAA